MLVVFLTPIKQNRQMLSQIVSKICRAGTWNNHHESSATGVFRTNHRPPNVELILLDLILDASDVLSQPLNSHPPVRAKGSNCPGPAELSITVDGTLNPGSLVKSYHGYGAQAWYPQGHQTSCYCWTFIHHDNMEKHSFWSVIEGSLEVKLPTIWRDEKQSRAEAERRGRLAERRSEEKE